MIIKKSKLNKIISKFLLETTTKEIDFNWGTYDSEHKDSEYFFLKDTELGKIQRRGDPYTYNQVKDGFVVVSGPKKETMGQKITNDSKGGKAILKALGQNKKEEVEISAAMLSSESVNKIKPYLEKLKKLQTDLEDAKGSEVYMKSYLDGKKVEGYFSFNKHVQSSIGLIKNSQPGSIRQIDKTAGLDKNNCEEFNIVLATIKKLQKKALPEVLGSIQDYIDQFMNDTVDSNKFNDKKVLELLYSYVNIIISTFPVHLGRAVDAPALSKYLDSLFAMSPAGNRIVEGSIFSVILDLENKIKGMEKLAKREKDPIGLASNIQDTLDRYF